MSNYVFMCSCHLTQNVEENGIERCVWVAQKLVAWFLIRSYVALNGLGRCPVAEPEIAVGHFLTNFRIWPSKNDLLGQI